MNLAEAEELAMNTEYAWLATHQDINPINKPDAGAFFLEGYLYAEKRIVELEDKIDGLNQDAMENDND